MNRLLEMIVGSLREHPREVMFWTQQGAFTGEEMLAYARRAAAWLKAQGVGKGDRITLELPRCPEYMGMAVGAMMRGAIFAALDSAYPRKRLEGIAEDCGARVRVTPERLEEVGEQALAEEEIVEMGPEDGLFLCFTSGSTGRPKGVLHTYASTLAMVARTVPVTDFRPGDRMASIAPFPFIAGIQVMLYLLAVGTPLYAVPDGARLNLQQLAEFTAGQEITHLFLSAATLPYFKQVKPTLRMVFIGGERAGSVWSEEFTIWNIYAMTETGVVAMKFKVDHRYENTPIGQGAGEVTVYLLDENGKEAQEGEICVAGQVAAGYWNLPEKTAQAFTPNPFREKDGQAVLYHTGDLGRRGEDGNITFLERKDWMVKVNGQRVEPNEIAGVLLGMPQILQAMVRDWRSADGQTYLAAYYRPVAPVTEEEIREKLREKLPAYMMPAVLIPMEQMPLTTTGKIDRARLPRPDSVRKPAPAGEEDRENAVVRGIREVLGEFTGRADYGYREDLIHAGISSLSAVKIAAGIMDRFGADLDVLSLLEGCSIQVLEEEILRQLLARGKEPAEAPRPLKERYRLTQTQLGIYGEFFRAPENVSYNIPFQQAFPAREGFGDRLEQALRRVLAAHESLLATVEAGEDGEVYEIPHPGREAVIARSRGSQEEFEARRREFVRPFRLEEALYRLEIFETPEQVHLLADFHHIAFDGSSARILLEDLTTALAGGTIPPERVSAFDLCEEEAQRRRSEEYRQAEAWVEKLLAETEKTTTLLADLPGGAPVKGHLRRRLALDPERVRGLSREAGAGENVFFQGVMGFVMARYSGEDTACTATVYNGRKGGRLGRTVGMLVKTLPVVCATGGVASPRELLAGLEKQLQGSMEHDLYSFAEIRERFGVGAETIFVYQGLAQDAGESLQAELEVEDIKNPLSVQVYPTGEGYLLDVVYDAARYSRPLMEGFAESFEEVARGFCDREELARVELAGPEQLAVLEEYNATEHEVDRTKTLVDRFREMARVQPEHPAVVCGEDRLTYGELDALSDRLACWVAGKGIGKDDFVAILADRSVWMAVAALGVLKAGAAYQPLDAKYPLERLEFMTRDSETRLLLTDGDLVRGNEMHRQFLEGFAGEVLMFEEIPGLPEGEALPSPPRPEDAVVILYTSGTTGQPKGCVIEHRQAAGYYETFRDFMELSPRSKVAMYASFGFDAGFQDIFTTLAAGGELHILTEEMRFDIAAMEAYFNEVGITGTFMTTQVGRMFVENTRVPSLRNIIVGGEKLVPLTPPEGLNFYNGYGPSETLCCVTHHRVTDDGELQPVGAAHFNTRLYVVDRYFHRLPVGALGELCIAGVQVSRGYLKRPEKNAQVFVENPFTRDPGYERIYRTGDVVRMLPGGEIDFVGRNDGQVKIRGNRVELAEVERTIRGYEGIRDAAVHAWKDPGGGQYIAAYVVSDRPVDPKALGEFITRTKPAYMVPAVTMQLEKIPLNVNGKVDRRKLPAPELGARQIKAPGTALQEKLVGLVGKVIGTERFGVDTDLREAGLTSLGSIRLGVLLGEAFGIAFSAADLQENNTVEKLEERILRAGPAQAFEVQDSYPLTQTQMGVFVECLARPESTVYNVPTLLKLGERPDVARLKQAVVRGINAHPFLLSTLFYDRQGEIRLDRQGVKPFGEEEIQCLRAQRLEEVRESLTTPFELVGGRLIRVKLIEAEAFYFFLDVHHILCDGTSLDILLESISQAYRGEEPAPEAFTGYEEALREQGVRAGAGYRAAKEYYAGLVQGQERSLLPAATLPAGEGGRLTSRGDPADAGKAVAYCRERKISLNGLLCGAFGAALASAMGRKTALFTTVYNGRSDSRLGGTVSMLAKTLPVAWPPRQEGDPAAAMGRQLMDSMAHDCYSFAEISRELGVRADGMFIYQGDGFRVEEFCELPAEQMELALSGRKEPLACQAVLGEQGLELLAEYDETRFTRDMMEELAARFHRAVAALAAGALPEQESPLWEPEELPAAGTVRRSAGSGVRDELTDRVCALFGETLGRGPLEPEEDFFQVGGNSILATKLVFLCMKADLPVVYQNIFENPTPAALAAFLRQGTVRGEAPAPEAPEEGAPGQLAALAGNVTGNLRKIRNDGVGDVLLTGATGYLGIHVLRELLLTTPGRVICLTRGGEDITAAGHLTALLHYYFEDLPESALDRVTVVEGDITDPELEQRLAEERFDTIFNCAANVKHFASDDSLERVNYHGVVNLIHLARQHRALLIQTSTVSVAGDSVDGSVPEGRRLRENELFIGQSLENRYVASKYRAEEAVLRAVSEGTLRAKVLRLGNLMSRVADGDFQINAGNSGFMRQIKAYIRLGCFPVDRLDVNAEFSPIDAVARAVVLLAGTPDCFTVFHANNCHVIHMANVLEALERSGRRVEIVGEEEFLRRFRQAAGKDGGDMDLAGIIAYLHNDGRRHELIDVDNSFTVKALYRLGFSWPLTDLQYVTQAIQMLDQVLYFDP